MSNTKVLNCSSSMRNNATVGEYNMLQSTKILSQQNSVKSRVMLAETTTATKKATQRINDVKKFNTSNLSPLNSPQLIRSTRVRVAECNGWNSSIKVKSSSSSGSNSVESIVPKYKIATNTTMSQKRSYLNQTSAINKLTNKIMLLRNDKSKKVIFEKEKGIENGSSRKETVSSTLAKNRPKSSFTTISPVKSFSAKFPHGLPFENEFYHYRKKNHRSSVASDSTCSNNSSDEFTNHQRLSNSPYQDEFGRNPSNDALYVDFTLKSFDKFGHSENEKNRGVIATINQQSESQKSQYILTDKNCFCDFDSVMNADNFSKPSVIDQHQIDFMRMLPAAKRVSDDSVIYVTKANIFPKCNHIVQPHQKNDNVHEKSE